jgi:hypothetical protein
LNATSYLYTWLANTATVAGPSSNNTYTLTSSDVGTFITCSVTAYDGSTASATPQASLPIGPVSAPLPGAPLNESPPVISGTAAEGQTVSCSSGGWSNASSYSYSWQRNSSDISGQTSSNYTLTSGDVNQVITCTVVAHNSYGDSARAVSGPIVPLAPASAAVPIDVAPPTITGTAVQGQTVTCSPGSWLSAGSYSYSWQRDGLNTAGATGNQYTLTSSDVNQAITCMVVAHNTFGASAPATSLPIIPAALGSHSGGGQGGAGSGTGGSGGPNGGGSGGSGKLRAPIIKAFSVVPGRMIVTVRGRRQTSKGVTFRYRLDRTAAFLVVLQRRLPGKVAGKRCVAPPRPAKGKRSKKVRFRHCTRYITVKVIAIKSARAGFDQLKYAGRIGKRLLPTSSYRVLAAAANAAGWSRARSANFAVMRKQAGRKNAGRRHGKREHGTRKHGLRRSAHR